MGQVNAAQPGVENPKGTDRSVYSAKFAASEDLWLGTERSVPFG